MNGLQIGQRARFEPDPLHVWDEGVSLPCRLRGRTGPVSDFASEVEIGPALSLRLAGGTLGYLSYEDGTGPVVLRGMALGVGGTDRFEFVVMDGVKVTDRRRGMRVPIVVAISMGRIPRAGSEPVSTVTSNLSAGGALVLLRAELGDGPHWRSELRLPDGGEVIRCTCEMARRTPTHLGVRFATIAGRDQLRIATLLLKRMRGTGAVAAQPMTSGRPNTLANTSASP